MQSLFKIVQSQGRANRGQKTRPHCLCFSIAQTGNKTQAAVFSIGSQLRKEMRWLIGDRVDVLYDPSLAEGQLVRCKEGGWAITGRGEGNTVRVRLNLRPEFKLPTVGSMLELACETTENTICFAFPTQYRVPQTVQK